MAKKNLTVGMVVLFFIVFSACSKQKYNDESDFQIRIVENKEVTIIGYQGENTAVKIPPKIKKLPVTIIGESAFSKKYLTNVSIPNTVTHIKISAFRDNELTSIVIPDSVTEIEQQVFDNNSLVSITIGANVYLSIIDWADRSFEYAYHEGGKIAGTYSRPDTRSRTWTKE